MQNKDTHIDQIFRNGLDDLKVIPPVDAWDGINGGIRSSRPILYLKRVAAAAVVLVVAGSAFLLLERNVNKTPTASNGQVQQNEAQSSKSYIQQQAETKVEPKGLDDMITAPEKADIKPVKNSRIDYGLAPLASLDGKAVARTDSDHSNVSFLEDSYRNSYGYLAMRSNKVNLIPEEEMYPYIVLPTDPYKNSNWGLNGVFSPIYSYRNSKVSDAHNDNSYYYNKELPDFGFTGGVNALFKKNRRLTIVTGLMFTRSEQVYRDVIFYENIRTGELLESGIIGQNSPYSLKTSLGSVNSGNEPHLIADYVKIDGTRFTGELSSQPEFDDYNSITTDINQRFEFLEIPFLLKYKILDKKLGINVTSGLGTNFLINNRVYMTHQGEKKDIGETSGLQNINFVGAFGLGLEYTLSRNFSLNIEPTFKYFLNSINKASSQNTHPYYFGIYSGFSYFF